MSALEAPLFTTPLPSFPVCATIARRCWWCGAPLASTTPPGRETTRRREALPIFLDDLVPSIAAIIISVTAVLFVGEVVRCSEGAGARERAALRSSAEGSAPFHHELRSNAQ